MKGYYTQKEDAKRPEESLCHQRVCVQARMKENNIEKMQQKKM